MKSSMLKKHHSLSIQSLMMKILKSFIVVMCLMTVSTAWAMPINENQAHSIAAGFMASHAMHSPSLRMAHKAPMAKAAGADNAAYYVFTGNQGGYVIVAGDDRAPAVLGYSDDGTYNLFESDWDLNYPGNDMVKGNDGIYRLTKTGFFLEGTEIKFKIVQDHSWDHAWPAEDWYIYIIEDGTWNFDIMFNPYNNDEDKIAVDINKLF